MINIYLSCRSVACLSHMIKKTLTATRCSSTFCSLCESADASLTCSILQYRTYDAQ